MMSFAKKIEQFLFPCTKRLEAAILSQAEASYHATNAIKRSGHQVINLMLEKNQETPAKQGNYHA